MAKKSKLQVEAFYLRKMLIRKVSPKEFFNYYKNKFFGTWLVKRLPKWSCEHIDHEFEIHILTQKSMLWPMAVLIRSFLYHSGLCPLVIIHVEPEFDAKTTKLLESKFDNVKVFHWDEATDAINKLTDIPDKIKAYRYGKNILSVKLVA